MTCPSCGRENEADARFCSACGTRLGQVEPTRRERKVVTVLFADLVGSTGRAEQLDPEDVAPSFAPYHARVSTELERFGGTVEKFIGDAVVALFGAPLAHEDDPERAVRAALADTRLRLAEDPSGLHVRIGVNTGEAIVALAARPKEGEGMATGDVVNTASRLQTAAPVNGILVDETTYRATATVIEYREPTPVHAKGKSEPVPVWEAAAGARASASTSHSERRGAGRPRRGAPPAPRCVSRSEREREPQLVTLVGRPGIGKCRLLFELSSALDADRSSSSTGGRAAACRTARASASGRSARW